MPSLYSASVYTSKSCVSVYPIDTYDLLWRKARRSGESHGHIVPVRFPPLGPRIAPTPALSRRVEGLVERLSSFSSWTLSAVLTRILLDIWSIQKRYGHEFPDYLRGSLAFPSSSLDPRCNVVGDETNLSLTSSALLYPQTIP